MTSRWSVPCTISIGANAGVLVCRGVDAEPCDERGGGEVAHAEVGIARFGV